MAKLFQIKIDGSKLVGEQDGAGRALIFLHAGVADKRMWHEQLAALSDRYRTVAYDRRGFGETIADPGEAFSHVEDLRAVLDRLDLETAVLIGCSQGGRVALDFALAYPQRVSALILMAPAVSGAPAPTTFPAEIEARLEALDEAEEAADLTQVNELEAVLWLDGPASPTGRVGGALRELFLDMNGRALAMPELTAEIEPAAAYERVAALSMPVLVLWGELDFPHVKETCRYLVDTIPAAPVKVIPDTAHLPNMEQPAQINHIISDFLG
jgi:pimeloyl-ACP methyl ester carboxylesterase